MKKMMIFIIALMLLTITACSKSTVQNTQTVNNPVQNNQPVNTPAQTEVQTANPPVETQSAPNPDAQKISDVLKTENVGKTVTVQGKVINTLRSARFNISGYKIQDSTGTIDVSSPKQPDVNTTVTVTGNLYQSRFFGLVINETD